MDGYFRVLAYDLVLFIDVGGGEVDHDIHDEHDVNWNRNKISFVWRDGDVRVSLVIFQKTN